MERKKSSSLILGAITGFDQALINPENRHLLDVADDPTNPREPGADPSARQCGGRQGGSPADGRRGRDRLRGPRPL